MFTRLFPRSQWQACILVMTVSLLALASASALGAPPSGSDGVIKGFIDFVNNIKDLSVTISEADTEWAPVAGSSARITASRTEEALSFEIKDNPFLGGMIIIIDGKAKLIYLLTPMSDEVARMPISKAGELIAQFGVEANLDTESVFDSLDQFIPVNITDAYAVEALRTEKVGQTDCYVLKLSPKQASSLTSYDLVWVNPQTYQPVRMEHHDKQGNASRILFSDAGYNSRLTQAQIFAPLNGKTIVDY